MAAEYSVEVVRALEGKFSAAGLYRPQHISRYDVGTELVYNVTSVEQADDARVSLIVEKFVGGGFAGQVYKVRVTNIESGNGSLGGIEAGGIYAMKILIPPSSLSRLFRNLLYWVGFQGPFQLQVNPAAARAGALWQKFIRRAVKIRFGDKNSVADIFATFVDERLGSCGELSEWVDGRTWRLEVDENMDLLKRWIKNKRVDTDKLGSGEYRAKKQFMADFVELLHKIGAYEFARQYEWSTCKSQPNCLKRKDTEDDASAGLTAVDFRAGLVLLAFLPMSPGDFKLIGKGLARGSLVQFDRGSLEKLEAYVNANRDEFADMGRMLEELKSAERIYRNSVPDVTHNHIRLLYSKELWSTMLDSAVTGWRIKNLLNDQSEKKLRKSRASTLVFFMIGILPVFGRVLRKIWGRSDWRRHYGAMLTSWAYFVRAFRAGMAEKVIAWHRAGRVDNKRAIEAVEFLPGFFCHLPLSILPASWHRFLTDSKFRREKLVYIFVRPVRLYFNAELRRQWLSDMVTEGQKKHILSDEDAGTILSQLNEPYIQKYLVSLVVHLLTLPVTQIVSITIATVYWIMHWGEPNAFKIGLGIIAVFQFIPISPGSLVRGFYVLYLVIRERDFRDYNIAVFLSFFKYIGYLAFPIQMSYHYPALARFMAAHWATEAVHIVPVFGERGALLEHWVFCLFYNRPLTVRRRMRKRAELRKALKPRYRHVGVCAIATAGIFGLADFIYLQIFDKMPGLMNIWWVVPLVCFGCGLGVTLWAGGAELPKRIVAATLCGIAAGVLYTGISAILSFNVGLSAAGEIAGNCFWRSFVFAIFSTIAAIITELKLPDADLQ